MYNRGHWGIGMITYAPIAFGLLWIDERLWPFTILGWIIVSVTCTLPDIDMTLKDYRWIPPNKHRGGTHTVAFAVVVGVVLAVLTYAVATTMRSATMTITGTDAAVTAVFTGVMGAYGVLSHLLGDIITPAGIRPFYPVSDKHYSYRLIYAEDEAWNYVFYIAGIILVSAAFLFGSATARSVLFEFLSSFS